MSEDGESANNLRIGRAVAYGCISLNSAFVVRNRRMRIFKKKALRLSIPEMIWISIASLIYVGLFSLAILILGFVPIINELVSWFMVIPAPIFGWFTGRRIARASPYRRHSGEGLGEYLWVQSDKLGPILGKIIGGHGFATSEVITMASGKSLTVESVEWIGTARAQLMPKYYPQKRNTSMDVILVPSSIPTNWALKTQAKRLQAEGPSFE